MHSKSIEEVLSKLGRRRRLDECKSMILGKD